jgi:cytoskeletal protein CcmA (bactofilin family)
MALWKDNTAPRPAPATPAAATTEPTRFDAQAKPDVAAPKPSPAPAPSPSIRPESVAVPRKESLIAVDLTIEGKIEGGGSVRIAGKFKGDVNVQGDLTIEPGAKLTGSVRADKVTIAGELEGNVEQAAHVNLMDTGVVIGDVKAGSLTVAAGARLRGQAEFGWDDAGAAKPARHASSYRAESGNAS